MPAPRVRILLLNWNNPTDTIECLESVFALDYERFDVVLCDNASTDASVAWVRAWAAERLGQRAAVGGAPYVEHGRRAAESGGGSDDRRVPLVIIHTGANLGFAGGNNVGLRYILANGSADYVWLLNNDTVVAPTALRALVDRALQVPDVGAVGGTLLEYHARDVVQDVAGGRLSRWHGMMSRIGHGNPASAPRPQPPRLDFISGGCMLVPVAVLERVGLLDERFFMYGEDADWCTRMRHRGLALSYAPLADVWHRGAGTSVPGSPAHEYHNVMSPLLLIHKHHPARLPVAFLFSLFRCLLPKVVRLQGRRLTAVVRAYRAVLRQLLGRAGNLAPAPAAPRAGARDGRADRGHRMMVDAATPPPSGAGVLRGRYLVRNRLLHAALATIDALLTVPRRREQPSLPAAPRRVLLAVGGHLGDAVILTAVLRHLRAVRPEAEIGVVLPSWARVVIERDTGLSWVHTVDHWKPNRSRASWLAKWRDYRSSRRAALRDIRAVGYDAAVDLRPHFPNLAGLLWRANVPVRVGFTSGGFGDLYTHPVPWRDDHRHVAARHVELLDVLLGKSGNAGVPRYALPVGDDATRARVSSLLVLSGIDAGEYLVVHMGSGSVEKSWSTDGWRAVAAALAADGCRLVFTGRGAEESAMVRGVAAGLPGSVDLCDRLDWSAFVEVIRDARMVLTVDTAAAHVAAATRTPCVAVWPDIASAPYWRPLGESVTLVTSDAPGAACRCGDGCVEMTCVRGLSVDAVLGAVRHLLKPSTPPRPTSVAHPEPAAR